MEKRLKLYIQGKNFAEEKVNEVIYQGYVLHSVTPVYNGAKTDLIYHFIKAPFIGGLEDDIQVEAIGEKASDIKEKLSQKLKIDW